MTGLEAAGASPQSVVIDVHTQNDNIGAQQSVMDPLVLPKSNIGMETEVLTLQQKYHQPSLSWKKLPASRESHRTRNPIRAVVDPIMASYHKTKHKQDAERPFILLAVSCNDRHILAGTVNAKSLIFLFFDNILTAWRSDQLWELSTMSCGIIRNCARSGNWFG